MVSFTKTSFSVLKIILVLFLIFPPTTAGQIISVKVQSGIGEKVIW